MSEIVKQRKYNFVTSVKLPKLEEIIEAASDFSTPTEKKILVGESEESSKNDISKLTKQVAMSKEQMELQKLGIEVADAELKRAKEKELARAEELRRLCREREMMAQKRAEEEAMKASDGTTAMKTVVEPVEEQIAEEVEQVYADLSDIAENPFDENAAPKKKEPAEKAEFHETVLEDDYTEEMGFLDDSSESVDDDFLDF